MPCAKADPQAKGGRAQLAEIIRARGRVAFTTFASNVGRLRSVARGRPRGRARRGRRRPRHAPGHRCRHRTRHDGRHTAFLTEEAYAYLPRDNVVVLWTGSQGEPRAALARVAVDDHPRIELAEGDIVVFSARAIPGNEYDSHRIMNALTERGIRVITDQHGWFTSPAIRAATRCAR